MFVHELNAKKATLQPEYLFRHFDPSVFRGRDVLSVDDFSLHEIKTLFELAADIKERPKQYSDALKGRTLALIFEKPSLRTRTTFTVAVTQLGGCIIDFPPGDIGLGVRESVHDVAKNLERMVDAVMIRTFGQEVVMQFADFSSIPVINGLTDLEHPCQAMADFFTILEQKKNIKNLKVSYIGDGNNVAHSLMLMAGKWGATCYIATPVGYGPDAVIVRRANELAAEHGGKIVLTNDAVEAAQGAHVIYTDTWTSMGQETEAAARRQIFKPYQVNRELFSYAKRDALFMHCLPAHRGEEVTDDVIDSPNSVVFDQAENRLHIQKALLCSLLGE